MPIAPPPPEPPSGAICVQKLFPSLERLAQVSSSGPQGHALTAKVRLSGPLGTLPESISLIGVVAFGATSRAFTTTSWAAPRTQQESLLGTDGRAGQTCKGEPHV